MKNKKKAIIVILIFLAISCDSKIKQNLKIRFLDNIEIEMYSKLDRSIFTSLYDDDPFENYSNFHGKRFKKNIIKNQEIYFESFVNEFHDEIVTISCFYLVDSKKQKIIDSLHISQLQEIVRKYNFKAIKFHEKNERFFPNYFKKEDLILINVESFKYKDMTFQGFIILDSKICNSNDDLIQLFDNKYFDSICKSSLTINKKFNLVLHPLETTATKLSK